MSELEELFAFQLRAAKLPEPEREFRFAKPRRYRFDFCWPAHFVAAEVEGGVHTNGRHLRASGFTKDCEKYNLAALMGWYVFRFPGSQVKNGEALEVIEQALAVSGAYNILEDYFDGDKLKIGLWLMTPNPNLGGVEPRDMIMAGKAKRLLELIEEMTADNP